MVSRDSDADADANAISRARGRRPSVVEAKRRIGRRNAASQTALVDNLTTQFHFKKFKMFLSAGNLTMQNQLWGLHWQNARWQNYVCCPYLL